MPYANKDDYKIYRRINSDYFNKKHKEWRQKNREQFRCNYTYQKYRKKHSIERGKCSLCFSENAEAHHNDYSKPLVIVWLCKDCHEWSHKMNLTFSKLEIDLKKVEQKNNNANFHQQQTNQMGQTHSVI